MRLHSFCYSESPLLLALSLLLGCFFCLSLQLRPFPRSLLFGRLLVLFFDHGRFLLQWFRTWRRRGMNTRRQCGSGAISHDRCLRGLICSVSPFPSNPESPLDFRRGCIHVGICLGRSAFFVSIKIWCGVFGFVGRRWGLICGLLGLASYSKGLAFGLRSEWGIQFGRDSIHRIGRCRARRLLPLYSAGVLTALTFWRSIQVVIVLRGIVVTTPRIRWLL